MSDWLVTKEKHTFGLFACMVKYSLQIASPRTLVLFCSPYMYRANLLYVVMTNQLHRFLMFKLNSLPSKVDRAKSTMSMHYLRVVFRP